MENTFLKALEHPETWIWVTRFEETEVKTMRHPPHQLWMQNHEHCHPHREIMITLEGSHFYGVRGKLYRADPGTIFLFDRGELHDRTYSPYHIKCRDLWIHPWKKSYAVIHHTLVNHGKMEPGDRFHPMENPLIGHLTEAWDTCSQGDVCPLSLARLRTAVTHVLIEAAHIKIHETTTETNKNIPQALISHIQSYIQNHLDVNLSLDACARISGYTPFYFHRLFQKQTGKTLHQYVNECRLEKAKVLLEQGQSVRSVTESLCFGTTAYFRRFFRKATGLSPSRFQSL